MPAGSILAALRRAAFLLSIAMPVLAQPSPPAEQVRAAERAFARTMAERDAAAFARHVADEAVFFSGPKALRGKAEVVAGWAGYFEGAQAPFSWDPDRVEVLASGTLALSSGLVRDPAGRVVARFTSIWRREGDSVWRVVFDKGGPPEPGDRP